MKKAIIAMLLMAAMAMADSDVFMGIWTNGTVNATLQINATNVNWWLNGYPGQVPQIIYSGDSFGWYTITNRLMETINWIFGLGGIKDDTVLGFIQQMSRLFFTRPEGEDLVQKVNILNLRVTALERTLEAINTTAYCNGRMSAMQEFNATSVTCGAATYYNTHMGIIGIEPLE